MVGIANKSKSLTLETDCQDKNDPKSFQLTA